MPTPVCFGTDGIRGRALSEITPDLAYRLGRAVAAVFDTPVFVGYDTRESSPQLAAAVLAGLFDGGAEGVNLGYFTTPGVAVIARQRGGVGVVVSASHNAFHDNGLKVLGPGGGKLDHTTEAAVTNALNGAARAKLRPDLIVAAFTRETKKDLAALLPAVAAMNDAPAAAAYVCVGRACGLPASRASDLTALLDQK